MRRRAVRLLAFTPFFAPEMCFVLMIMVMMYWMCYRCAIKDVMPVPFHQPPHPGLPTIIRSINGHEMIFNNLRFTLSADIDHLATHFLPTQLELRWHHSSISGVNALGVTLLHFSNYRKLSDLQIITGYGEAISDIIFTTSKWIADH